MWMLAGTWPPPARGVLGHVRREPAVVPTQWRPSGVRGVVAAAALGALAGTLWTLALVGQVSP